MCTHTDDTAFVEVFGGVLANVGDIVGELFHTALGLAYFEGILVDVYRGKDIVADYALVEHDGVLVVVTLPRHERNLEVAAQCELAVLGGVAFGEYIAFVYALALVADGAKVDCGALVGLAPLGYAVGLDRLVESDELLFVGAVVADTYACSVYKLDHTFTLGCNLCAAVAGKLCFDTGTYDRSLAAHKGHSLTHHVRSHECAVGVVMLEEGDQRRCD